MAAPTRRWRESQQAETGAVLPLNSAERMCFTCPLAVCQAESKLCPYNQAQRAVKLGQERTRRSRSRASGAGRG